jgi:phospholipase C
MSGFLSTTGSVPQQFDANGTRAMGYYDSTDRPYYYDLATFFATSDSWHSPILANMVPNRMYLMAGTSFGHEYPDLDSNQQVHCEDHLPRHEHGERELALLLSCWNFPGQLR